MTVTDETDETSIQTIHKQDEVWIIKSTDMLKIQRAYNRTGDRKVTLESISSNVLIFRLFYKIRKVTSLYVHYQCRHQIIRRCSVQLYFIFAAKSFNTS